MKNWPHDKTNLDAVTPRSLSQWRYWKMRIAMTTKTVAWLRKQPQYTPEEEAKLLDEQVRNIEQAEICRQDCRRQDICHRWDWRWFNRSTQPVTQADRWNIIAMTYDQYHSAQGRLRE